MYKRLGEIPVFETRDSELDAIHFNHVQVALKRLGEEIRLQIPRLKHLDLILQKDAWILVDRVLNDVPVAAWTEFEVSHRDNLHQPVNCKLRLYHNLAHMVLEHTIEAMELILGEQLQEYSASRSASVAPLRKKD
jgi:hypothetical protein